MRTGQRNKEDVVCCTTMKEKPASDVTIVESLQSSAGSESETDQTTDPLVPSSCVGTNVVDLPNHFGADAPRGAYPFMVSAFDCKYRQM